ncbi:hypothetical protein DFH28DRAFT_933990 [Melampsora americana]|nr:hypothetical protein DFH28DRAFT_933990 [Melampsora americana]
MTIRGFRNFKTLDSSGSISNSGLVTRSSQVSNKRSSTADMQADLDDLEKTLAALSPQALKFSPRTSPLVTDELLKKLKQKEERRSHRGKELNEVRPPLPLPSKPSQPPQPLPLPSRAAP